MEALGDHECRAAARFILDSFYQRLLLRTGRHHDFLQTACDSPEGLHSGHLRAGGVDRNPRLDETRPRSPSSLVDRSALRQLGSGLTTEDLDACHTVSTQISAAISSIPQHTGATCSGTPVTATPAFHGEEAMRQLYLRMVCDKSTRSDLIFEQLALPLKRNLELTHCAIEFLAGERKTVNVVAGEGDHMVCMDKEAFSMGRWQSCDVSTGPLDSAVSRMHCWVFNLPGAIVVVDGWSAYGTWVTSREEQINGLPRSMPRGRRAFIIPHGEAVMLCLGGTTEVTFNPKLCIVCLERPRSVRLSCGHQAFCSTCIQEGNMRLGLPIAECPICRASIHAPQPAKRAACEHTCVPQHRPVGQPVQLPALQFHDGELVEYWSRTHSQWMPAVVLKRCELGTSGYCYDLDVKRGAEPARIRSRRQRPPGVGGA